MKRIVKEAPAEEGNLITYDGPASIRTDTYKRAKDVRGKTPSEIKAEIARIRLQRQQRQQLKEEAFEKQRALEETPDRDRLARFSARQAEIAQMQQGGRGPPRRPMQAFVDV